ncbi:hypothetical protein A5N78_24100 [Prescottella equi]|nr:hypothetical protein [Prescottella equi]ORL85457.1 hypothetical protein A5N78_24100 [Prescottella equi]ORM11103.1 hypothetical protein A5N70_23840 [Prescottella equi]
MSLREVDPAGLQLGADLVQVPPQIAPQIDHASCRGFGEPEDAGDLDVRELAARLVPSRSRILLAADYEQGRHPIDLAELLAGDSGVLLGECGGRIRSAVSPAATEPNIVSIVAEPSGRLG